MIWKQATTWGIQNPRSLFLIDGLGALLSAFLLGVVLVELQGIFGIPPSMLYLLALFPVLFAAYDFFCYQKKRNSLGRYLQGIAWMNIAYCVLSIGLAGYHAQEITHFGEAYLAIEILLVFALALLELRVAKSLISAREKAN